MAPFRAQFKERESEMEDSEKSTATKLSGIEQKRVHALSEAWNRNAAVKKYVGRVKRFLSKPELFELLPITSAQNAAFHPVSVQILREILKTTKPRVLKQDFEDLLDLIDMLNDMYGIEIRARKSTNGKIEVEKFPARSTWETFQIMGSTLRRLKSNRKETSPLDSLVNQVEVGDITPRSSMDKELSPLSALLYEISNEVTPTVIKVIISDRVKRFLIYVPRLLNISTLNEVYRPALRKIQSDFYAEEYRGRPKSKRDQEQRIFSALKKYKGKKISIDDLCRKAAKKIELISPNDRITPSTIKRHYLHVIRRIKQAKIRR